MVTAVCYQLCLLVIYMAHIVLNTAVVGNGHVGISYGDALR